MAANSLYMTFGIALIAVAVLLVMVILRVLSRFYGTAIGVRQGSYTCLICRGVHTKPGGGCELPYWAQIPTVWCNWPKGDRGDSKDA